MRPKVVIVILLLGVAALGLLGIMQGVLRKQPAASPPAPEVPKQTQVKPASNNVAAPGQNSNLATTAEEQAAMVRDQNLEVINNAMLNYDDDPHAILLVANLLENADEQVRVAAREAAMHIGDTNIIPYLTSAAQNIQNPREKVALLDAIEYLKLSTEVPDTSPTDPRIESLLTNRNVHPMLAPPSRPGKPGRQPLGATEQTVMPSTASK